ncbi:MAG: hypothetical protein LBT30_07570 [Clostridiales bacterium]|jgi:hypothetical protein|nr:hypothetical protein [Clostridiales bacterium]
MDEKKERSAAQKEADRRYRLKKIAVCKETNFMVTLPTVEAKRLILTIKNAGMTRPAFLRKAYELIFNEKL